MTNIVYQRKYKVYRMISDTTRFPKPEEKEGVDYRFIHPLDFLTKEYKDFYLETTEFNGWHYGTPKTELKNDINIGVFDPQGLKQLMRVKDLIIIPVYLSIGPITSIKRAINREYLFKFEHIRRAIVDTKDLRHLETFIQDNFQYYLIIKNIDGVVKKAEIIYDYIDNYLLAKKKKEI